MMQPAITIQRRPYASDLSHAEWQISEPLLPTEQPGGKPRGYAMREIINALSVSHPRRWRMAVAAA